MIVGMRMIEADDIQAAFTSVFFSAHELLWPNQEPIPFSFFFARVRNRISLHNNFASIAIITADQKSAAFKRIVTFAMPADFLFVSLFQNDQRDPITICHRGAEALRESLINEVQSFSLCDSVLLRPTSKFPTPARCPRKCRSRFQSQQKHEPGHQRYRVPSAVQPPGHDARRSPDAARS